MAIDLNGWNKTITRIAKHLHTGKLKPSDLDQDLIQRTFTELNKAAAEGYGANYTSYSTENSKTVQQLQQNIYQFSAAKTFQQLQKYNSLLVDENGKERSFSSFKKAVLAVHPKYNTNYLQAEYQTAKASAQMARKWQGFQRNKARFPYLKYKTASDDHVRDDHQRLQNFTAHIDDRIWDKIYPPNGWRCRCYIVQTNEASNEPSPDTSFIDPEFSLNVGKTGVIFSPEHPYFVFPKKDEDSYKKAFETFKLIAPYGKAKFTAKNGAKVFVSPFAGPNDLEHNFEVAKVMANTLKKTIKIRPHTDGTIILNAKNPEYLVNKKIADLKAPKGVALKNIFKKANKQKTKVVVIDLLNNPNSFAQMKLAIIKRLGITDIYPNIEEVILISKDRKTIEVIKRKK